MVIKTIQDKIGVNELSKAINNRKTNDTQKHNRKIIEETLNRYEKSKENL